MRSAVAGYSSYRSDSSTRVGNAIDSHARLESVHREAESDRASKIDIVYTYVVVAGQSSFWGGVFSVWRPHSTVLHVLTL